MRSEVFTGALAVGSWPLAEKSSRGVKESHCRSRNRVKQRQSNVFSQKPKATSQELLRLRRQRQSEYGNHSLPGDIHFRFSGGGQIQRLAVFAAVDFSFPAPSFL